MSVRAFFMTTARNLPILRKLSVKYNNTAFAYLTSAPFSDTASFFAGSNVISVDTIVTDDYLGSDNANTGLAYDFTNDWFVVKDWGPLMNRFFDRSLVQQLQVQGFGNQGTAYDHIRQLIYEYDLTTLREINLSGTNVSSQGTIAPSPYTSGGLFYNPFTGELLLTDDLSNVVRIYQKQGSTWVYEYSTWWGSSEGIGYDYIADKVVSYSGAIKLRTRDGQYNLQYPLPTVGSRAVTEGMIGDPRDGTFWFNSDEHFHGGIVGGNRLWHTDPREWYGKYIRFSDMIRYDLFKIPAGTRLRGSYNYQKLYGNNEWVTGPVIDFESFTEQQTLANWETADNVDLEFRGSGTAPDTTPTVGPPPHDLDIYNANNSNDGWGTTSPGSWQSTPTTNRYMQFRVMPLAPATVPATWTPANLGAKLLIWVEPYDLTSQGKSAYNNDVEIWMNKAQTDGGDGCFFQNTDAFKPQWNASLFNSMTGNRHAIVAGAIGTGLLSAQQGEWNIVGKRQGTGTRAVWPSTMNTGTVASQFRIFHFPTGGGQGNWQGYTIVDDTAAVTYLAGVTNNTTAWQRLSFGSDGSENYIYINGTKQTLTVTTGTNTGQWFGDVVGSTQTAIGILDTSGSSVTGAEDVRLIIYTNAPLTTQEHTDLQAYVVAKSLL